MKRFLSLCFLIFFTFTAAFSQSFNITNDDWSKSDSVFGASDEDTANDSFEIPETKMIGEMYRRIEDNDLKADFLFKHTVNNMETTTSCLAGN